MKQKNLFKLLILILVGLNLIECMQQLDRMELNSEDDDDDRILQPIRNKNIPDYSCRNKEDDGYYEHEESCHKYWHCLYVDTIFERAFERKCPIGTMFHPLLRSCEISTMLTCHGWKKSIFGKDYAEQQQQLKRLDVPLIQAHPIDSFEETTQPSEHNLFRAKLRSTKPVIFKAYITTTTTTTSLPMNILFSFPYGELVDLNQEDYSFETALLDTTSIQSFTSTSTTTSKRTILSIPSLNKHSNIVKKVIPSTSTTTSTTKMTTTTSTSTTTTTSSTTTTSTKTTKRFKNLKAKTSKPTSTKSSSKATPTLEDLINLKLNYLSSNKLNKTQIFEEIESIKILFDEHAKRNSTISVTTITTTTASTTTTTTSSTKPTTTTTSTLLTTIDEEDNEDYEYELRSSLLKNGQLKQSDLLPLVYVVTTTPRQANDYVYEDEESNEYELNSKRKESHHYESNIKQLIEKNSLQSNDLVSDTYDPVEAAITSSASSLLLKSNKLLILLILIKIFY